MIDNGWKYIYIHTVYIPQVNVETMVKTRKSRGMGNSSLPSAALILKV